LEYPLLLENVPEVEILAYSLETVVAEKFEAMISLSVNNSRMKDFFDVYRILKEGNLDEEVLKEAVKNTFENRGTGYVGGHPLFGEEFFKDPIRTSRWNGFLKSIRTNEQIAFEEVGEVIQEKMKGYWEIVKEREKT
jgi:prephenate dehydrogenase